ncbi:taste receptor type 2 member 60 [Erinaceus europaeus]|uniref:Taste receptor type 2 n=1 Tax=Erinaceus europaeus TaxID=9365 RepID=A0A1S3WAD1_ERIEU|nr:taste receptor type 2 member 60 [Erinaceus europaeus]
MHGDSSDPRPLAIDKGTITLTVFLLLLCLVAVVGNGLIIAALSVQWLLRRMLSPCDKLLVSLGVSRFCLQWVVITKTIYIFLHPQAFPYNPVWQCLSFQWDFLNAVTLWLSAWLSIYYCVKIATFTQPVFLWLKRKVSGLVLWMLLSSVGFSSFSAVLFLIGNHQVYQNYLKRNPQIWNVTGDAVRRSYERFYFLPLKLVTWTVPVMVFLVGMGLLLSSLGRHTWKTIPFILGGDNLSTQSHVKALLALGSFAVLFVSYFLSLLLSAAGIFPSEELRYWVWQAVIYLCAAIHPIVLLLSSPRLRAVLRKVHFSRRWPS